MLEFRITEDSAGQRLDKFLRRQLFGVPPSHLFKMIRVKKVRVNGARAQPAQPLAVGDVVTVRGTEDKLLAERPVVAASPREVEALNVLLEDEWLMIIDKPTGMAVHPGSGITRGTVVDIVRAYLGDKAERNGFVASPAHRIDKDTSGVLVVAKRRPAMVHMTELFTAGKVKKRYLALAQGRFADKRGTIDTPLPEKQQTRRSKDVRGVNMQEAVTHYEVLGAGQECSYLSCTIETGRTHQIRRHLASIGHPLAGDERYGDFGFNRTAKAFGVRRLFLHAARIEFSHPKDGHRVVVEAPLPAELNTVLATIGATALEKSR